MEKEQVGLGTKIKRFFQRFELKAEAPQSLLTAGLWQIIGTTIAALLNWLLLVIISRDDVGLGPSGIGIFNTTFAIICVFSILTIGMGKSTAQKVSENISDKAVAFEHARNGTFAAILMGIILGSILITCSFVIGAPLSFQETNLSTILFISGILMCVAGIRDGLLSNLAAVGEYDEIAISYMLIPLTQFLTAIPFIFLIKTFSLPSSLILIAYIFGIIVQTFYLTKHFRHLWFNTQIFRFHKVNRQIFKIVRQGFYFSITDIIPTGLLGSTLIIILLFFTQSNYEIVGAFSIITGYALGGLVVTGFAWPLITSVAEAYGKKDTAKIKYYLHLMVKIFFYLTFLVLAIDIGLSYGILLVFHGPEYLAGSTDVWLPFILVFSAYAIASFEYILCGILLGVGKGRSAAIYLGTTFLVTSGCATLFFLLNLFSLPQLNLSFGFLIGLLIMLPFLPYLIKKHLEQKIPFLIGLKSLAALLCTLLIAAVLLWPPLKLIPLNVVSICLMGLLLIIIYVLLLIFFGAISQEDFYLLERKAAEYGLKKSLDPILRFLRKLMRISPFCDFEKCIEPE